MSIEYSSSSTPDGRFEITLRVKDEWGDWSCDDRDWTLHDHATHTVLGTWHHEDDDDVRSVRFSDDFKCVLVEGPRESSSRIGLPPST